ncbi:hypothetical protein JOM56_000890 [Amanita muscaria]
MTFFSGRYKTWQDKKAQTSKKIKESKSAIVEITSTSDEDLVASVDKSVKRKKPQLNPVASLNSVSTSNRGSKKLKIEDDDLFHKVDHDIDIAKRIRTPSAKAKAAESAYVFTVHSAADSGDSDQPLTALQSKVSKDFLAESSHVATLPPSSKKKGKAKVNESIFEADNTREDHSATSYKVKLELAEVILDGKKKRTIHFSDSEAEGNIDKEENTLPNTETVNGPDEINYLDDIQGVETDHTLALMPVELRDLRLMDSDVRGLAQSRKPAEAEPAGAGPTRAVPTALSGSQPRLKSIFLNIYRRLHPVCLPTPTLSFNSLTLKLFIEDSPPSASQRPTKNKDDRDNSDENDAVEDVAEGRLDWAKVLCVT